jgi:hypothetical protein
MFSRLWRWFTARWSRLATERPDAGRFDAIVNEAQSEVAALIDHYRRTRRAA